MKKIALNRPSVYRLVLSGLFLAIGVTLPIAFHAVPNFGAVFLPMHVPVLLCGLICGWRYGLPVGLLLPLLAFLLTGRPPIYPVGLSMMLELGTYGLVAGLLAKKQRPVIALLCAMGAGRLVMGLANGLLLGLSDKGYSFAAFIAGAFVTAAPGILVQLVLIPLIMAVLKKNRLLRS